MASRAPATAPAATAAGAIVVVGLGLFLALVFVGVVAGVGALLGVEGPNTALMLLATALVAVGFEPLRGRLSRFAERVVRGLRVSSWEAVSRLSAEMANQEDPEEVLATLARVARAATRADHAVVWLRVDRRMVPTVADPASRLADLEAVDAQGDPGDGTDLVVPIRHASAGDAPEQLGAIAVAGLDGAPVTSVERKLMEDLAAAVGPVARTVELRESLRRRLELASRQQDVLVAARARVATAHLDERRRLERNLHDSGQQRAVALTAKLGLAESLATTAPDQVAPLLAEAAEDLDQLEATLDGLAAGRATPGLLDDGIGAALAAETADLGVRVDVLDETDRPLPPPVAEAAHACCTEAVQNALKHAAAAHVEVRLHRDADELHLSVRDDGVGIDLDSSAPGTGLVNMRERLAELGGSLTVEPADRGTEVRGRIPLTAGDGS